LNEPWYSKGLLFSCMHCGRCCRRPGIVTLTASEIKEIADFLGLSRREFFWRFATVSGEKIILKDGPRGECTFYEWDSGLCLVYPSRPAQCRTYPFWHSVMATEESWEREGSFCPGIGQGGVHSAEWIDGILSGEKLALPEEGNGMPACDEDAL